VVRGAWFAWLAAIAGALVLLRLVRRRPLFDGRARRVPAGDLALAAVSLVLLVFHCLAMFAPGVVGAVGVLDAPAARVRDLGDLLGQLAFWVPALGLVVACRSLWWPAPLGVAVTLAAVGGTMYAGSFTLTEHVATIVVAGVTIALVAAGLVAGPRARTP
jgi:hypothetical protein